MLENSQFPRRQISPPFSDIPDHDGLRQVDFIDRIGRIFTLRLIEPKHLRAVLFAEKVTDPPNRRLRIVQQVFVAQFEILIVRHGFLQPVSGVEHVHPAPGAGVYCRRTG